jgi:probable F420-dependent oxidoreductase
MVLSESWTLTPPRDLRALVEMAVTAEAEGVDGVMLSEHIVLGGSAGARGLMANPREYAAPGNQDPAMPWPSSTVLLSAIAARTVRLRLVAGAIIAPLRHPLILAKDLGTLDLLAEGRLVVLPTVSWHEDEYAALGVPFHERGAILDEQLEVLRLCWTQPGPVSHHGRYYAFDDVWVEPMPYAPGGPALWFGGQRLHGPLLRRLVRWGSGFNPFGSPTAEELALLREELVAAGRDPAGMEMVGGIRGSFPDDSGPADLDEALASLPAQLAAGFDTICFKPSMYLDDPRGLGPFCRILRQRVEAIAG